MSAVLPESSSLHVIVPLKKEMKCFRNHFDQDEQWWQSSSGDSGASVGVGGGGGADDGADTDGDGVGGVHLSSLLLLLAVVASRSRNLDWNKYLIKDQGW